MKRFIIMFLVLLSPLMASDKCAMEARVHRVSPNEVILGITLTPVEGWHTYWSNPGEAGLALSIELEDAGVKVLAEEFPVPKRFSRFDIITYEYSGAETFLYSLSGEIPEELKGEATWLVCDDSSCLPASGMINLKVPKKVQSEQPAWLKEAIAAQPATLKTAEATAQLAGKKVTFTFQSPVDVSGWSAFPYSSNLKDLKAKIVKVAAPQHEAAKKESEAPADNESTETAEEGADSPEEAPMKGDFYSVELEMVEEMPESVSFLLTNGSKAYSINL